MTGRVRLTPEAEQQLDDLDDWLTRVASADVAQGFVTSLLDHMESIAVLPLAGRDRGDVRPGLRTSTFRARTVVAYEVDPSAAGPVVVVLGVFHGGRDWQSELGG